MDSAMKRYFTFVFVLIIFITSFAHLATSRKLSEEVMMLKKHEEWMVRHGRVYNSKEEREARFKIFKDNIKFIEDFNRAGNHTYKIGITKFTDLTPEEFKATYASGYKESSSSHPDDYSGMSFRYENVNVADLPSSVDWIAKGAVTPVKNQGHCYSCWAFAAVASIEGINKIKTGKLISLSEQEILDCMGLQDSCYTGGLPENAFDFIAQSGGLATESDYPYNEQYHEACHAAAPAARITSFERVPPYDEVSLLKAVANQPVSVGINANFLQFYTGGVITTMDYTSPLNHGVTIVGYGTDEETGVKYWLVKNSWGANWGPENGYIRVQRDSGLTEGTLGIATNPTYPVV